MVMNILFKIGEVVFKIIAIFLILLALLLEHFSKIKSVPKNEFDYSEDNKMRKSFRKYPNLKHYGY